MPICIECRYPVHQLYTTYSRADDRALGKGVRLTQCPRCKGFADKYVEHDFVVLFIDLVLIKPQVYRHLLFNRLGREDDRFDPSIIRLGTLLLLFDVYLTWARIEKASSPPSSHSTSLSSPFSPSVSSSSPISTGGGPPTSTNPLFATQPLFVQYLFFLFLCAAETVAFHLPIRLLCASRARAIPLLPHYPHPVPLSTALLVSSCTKLFPLLLIIWPYDLPSSASAVSWAVIVNNVAALEILLDCGYARAGLLVGVGAAVRAVVGGVVLGAVGLSDGGAGGVEGWGWGRWRGV
ncbi:Arv1 protein [Lineolata rhizophorae]|uniref:Protein ARV n=1 Tax=Lineolata rhizophorae TaxID=578093 RepID=A0A6A6NUP8_9PEZI|nr:Arv1 protein [Lineolata rhizophorae]